MERILAFFLVLGIFLAGCPQEGSQSDVWDGSASGSTYCSDSDGGRDESTRGTVSTNLGKSTDICIEGGAKVMEYYCSGNERASEEIECPGGQKCTEGACGVLPCFDTDGGADTSVMGTVNYDGQHTDSCIDEKWVREFSCGEEGMFEEAIACATGEKCSQGKCVEAPQCVDSDGGDTVHEGGTVVYRGKAYEDECLSNNVVYEYYCENGELGEKQLACPDGEECFDGVCGEVTEKECEDSDGGNRPSRYGEVTYWSGGEEYSAEDICYDGDSVLEYWCTEEGTLGVGIMECDSGEVCLDGECED